MAQDNANIKSQLTEQERYAGVRSQMTDKNFADLNAQVKQMQDLPFRMGAQEAKTASLSDRVDRLADAILANQEALRKDFNSAVEVIRKDFSGLSTKVEVLDSKMDSIIDKPRQGASIPMQPRL
ncbi:hypothetical protein SJ05684_c30650 [Sinorhizobium sojae CCBAU 05684]|uniref:Uncharacterized protein n=2 Tax=Sinorhizobium sojae TaxID=716925 RepID=A0A249PFI6_9HYPH|nr:hypothetical protein SJ05684_c30100 [Sinorhizobium sojae CCBAU 05684]ASY64489.1 hypothetical protein SJ05684_c30650 [Sinorhizobium sojae CCBAU 05684]